MLQTLRTALSSVALFAASLGSAPSLIVDVAAVERAAARQASVWDARSANDRGQHAKLVHGSLGDGKAAGPARCPAGPEHGMSLKPIDDLKALYAKLDPARETVVCGQSSVCAPETAVVLRSLGFNNVKAYPPSWLG